MARQIIDQTGNESADIARAKMNANFSDLYGGAGGVTGPTGPTGTTGPTGPLAGHTGTFTANGASAVTVSDANVTANSLIVITLKTVGGTVGAYPAIKTITPTTGFTVAATASDTSVYNYGIIG